MRVCVILSVLVAAFIIAECSHTFMGTNVMRQVAYHAKVHFNSKFMRKRVENVTITVPAAYGYGRSIQGILAYDLTNSKASANVTAGGLGFPFVTLRMKSERGLELNYNVYVYI